MTGTQDITDYDVIILDHDDLDEFMDAHGETAELLRSIDVFTEDEYTKNKVEFNLIAGTRNEYGIATQIHNPVTSADSVLDLRDTETDFSDWAMGLA